MIASKNGMKCDGIGTAKNLTVARVVSRQLSAMEIRHSSSTKCRWWRGLYMRPETFGTSLIVLCIFIFTVLWLLTECTVF